MVSATIFKLRRHPFISPTAPRPTGTTPAAPLSRAPIFHTLSPAPVWILIDIFNKKLTKCLKYIAFYNLVDDHLTYNANYNKKNKKREGCPSLKLFTIYLHWSSNITYPNRANVSSNQAVCHCQNPDRRNRSYHHNNREYCPAVFQDRISCWADRFSWLPAS